MRAVLFYIPGLVELVRREEGQRGFLPCLRIGNQWILLLMHESGLQGHPAGCPALVKATASGHSSLLYDVKSTDLCYGYQSELTLCHRGAFVWHTHTHKDPFHISHNGCLQKHTFPSFSNTHPWTSNQHLRKRSHLQCRGLYAEKTQVIGGGRLWYLWRIVAR